MKTSAIIGSLVAAALVGTVGYAVYFDYKRRNDAEFRKNLKKQKKKAEKQKQAELKEKEEKIVEALTKALNMVKNEVYPSSNEEKEKYFMENLQNGEQIFRTNPENVVESAVCFYKAVKVYPNPIDLLVMLQKSIPEEIVGLVYAMISTEAQKDQNKYYANLTKRFPTVVIKEKPQKITIQGVTKNVAVPVPCAERDFKSGDVIYTEDPSTTCLKMECFKTHCHGCMQPLPESMLNDQDGMICCDQCHDNAVFCSTRCMKRAMTEFHLVLCPGSNPKAKLLFDYCKQKQVTYPMMVAKFLARMIYKQTVQVKEGQMNVIASEWEHLEKLRLNDMTLNDTIEEETKMIRDALKTVAPGTEEFLTPERYLAIKGNLMFNSVGLYDPQTLKPNESEEQLPRIACDPSQVHGIGLYFLTAYMKHGKEPNVEVSFKHISAKSNVKTTINTPLSPKLVLRAIKDIKEGDEFLVSYLPVNYPMDPKKKTESLVHWDLSLEETLTKEEFEALHLDEVRDNEQEI